MTSKIARAERAEKNRDIAGREISLGSFLTYRFSRVQAKLNAQAIAILRETSGLSLTQWRILAYLGIYGEATATEIAEANAFDKALISRNIKPMIDEKLIAQKLNPNDQRSQRLSLRPRGKQLYEATLPRMRNRQSMLMGSLTPLQQSEVHEILDRLESASDRRDI